MKRSLSVLLTLAMATAASRAMEDAMLFTTLNQVGPERTLSGTSGTSLARIDSQDVAVIIPDPNVSNSAEKFATRVGYSTLIGDANGDGVFFEPIMMCWLDAIFASSSPTTQRDLFVSSAVPVGGPGCPFTWQPGDVAAIDIGGVPRVFISEQQVRQAFQIPMNMPANVDAFERDSFGNLVLSFEDNVVILGAIPVQDGSILGIPAAAITYVDGLVSTVAGGSGLLLFDEGQVDGMVVNANVSNPALGLVTTIGDLDGLCEDPLGGTFWRYKEGYGNVTFSDLMFSGVQLMGGGVLSTAAGGSIAVVNGDVLAASAGGGGWFTDGIDVGLDPTLANVGSLNGLELTPEATRFVIDTPAPMPIAGGNIELDVGGTNPGAPVVMLIGAGPTLACDAAISFALPNAGFPDICPFVSLLSVGVADAQGVRALSTPFAGGVPAGTTVVFQALSLLGPLDDIGLSAPVTLQF